MPVVRFRRLHAQEASLAHGLFDVRLVVLPRPGIRVRVSLTTSLPKGSGSASNALYACLAECLRGIPGSGRDCAGLVRRGGQV